jgi:hypothetical protein
MEQEMNTKTDEQNRIFAAENKLERIGDLVFTGEEMGVWDLQTTLNDIRDILCDDYVGKI